MGYDPENYSQAQLNELDSLTERWVGERKRFKNTKENSSLLRLQVRHRRFKSEVQQCSIDDMAE
jgi:hypothetical protein